MFLPVLFAYLLSEKDTYEHCQVCSAPTLEHMCTAISTLKWCVAVYPPVAGTNVFTELEGARLVSAPTIEHSLAVYLAQTQNGGIAGTPILSKGPCQFS